MNRFRFFRKKIFNSYFLCHSFPWLRARIVYNYRTDKILSFSTPKDFNQKLFWLHRYWQDPKIVLCSDKIKCREYVKSQGLSYILTKHYAIYNRPEDIDISKLPSQFVLKMNNSGAGWFISICKDKSLFNELGAKYLMACGMRDVPGLKVCDYHYQYIEPKIIAEEFIDVGKDGTRLEIQFFCFNGKAKHILVRNDLGDAARESFAISYDMNWNRMHDRKDENMDISVPRPKLLDQMINIANKLAEPFPHVRVDLYYVDDRIIFGELTFTTAGKILNNYTDTVLRTWGEELQLPPKIKTKWKTVYNDWSSVREKIVIPDHVDTEWNVNKNNVLG